MSSSGGPGNYADAVTQAQELIRQGRLSDPGEHFPYRRSDAEQSGLNPGIAAACEAYVEAQQAYLGNPGDGTRGDYEAAKEALVLARREERIAQRRPGSEVFTNNTQEG